ncbi:uncharacterized protein LOC126555170 [Aphis gossypii]|uniref:uncharacterized protein LOC126555170 n=1 Tax=Aphis gossypii TaxID=80765 RepID=UPI002158D171|nr:uncharacterized protein LOC126555170 [Aphis gossypii]
MKIKSIGLTSCKVFCLHTDLLYQREPILPVDVKYSLNECGNEIEENVFTGEFNEDKFKETLQSMLSMREKIQDNVSENIQHAQNQQKISYAKRHPRADNVFEVGDKVLLKNLRREDRKGGWSIVGYGNLYITFNISIRARCKAKCRALRLEYIRSLESDVKIKVLSHPYKIQKIIGDGNCLFRAFSYLVTGTEEQHLTIRQNIATVVNTNQKILRYVGGEEQLQSYLKKNKIENEGVWGTDTEIFAAAIYFKTSVYVYCTQTHTWQLFSKEINLKNALKRGEKCLYLVNQNNTHYEVVIDVTDID